jgi:hypothetical protein
MNNLYEPFLMVVPLANTGLCNVTVSYPLSLESCKNDHQINCSAPFFLQLTALFRVRYVNWAIGPIVGTCAADPVLRGVKVGETRSIRSKGVPKTMLQAAFVSTEALGSAWITVLTGRLSSVHCHS